MKSLSSRSSSWAIGIAFGVITSLGIVILSPFALAVIANSKQNWVLLSNIGQTYGAVAALISSLALAGVIVSLLYQRRDSRAAHEQITRSIQHELMKMEMVDPELMTATGAPWGLPIPAESAPIRQYLYVRMWVTFLAGNYAIGESTEAAVRYIAANELFRSQAGRDYWQVSRSVELQYNAGRRGHFFRILDEEYERVLSNKAPISEPVKTSNSPPATKVSRHRKQAAQLGLVAVGAVAGAFLREFWSRR